MNWMERKIAEMEINKMLGKISWRTTTWGVVGIAGAIGAALYQYHLTGHFDFEATMKTIMGIATGCGLLAAADHKNLPPQQ